MDQDLAVRAGGEAVAARLELAADPLEVIELAVDHRVHRAVLTGERLIAGGEIDDAEPRVAEPDPPRRTDPLLAAVGAAVMKGLGRSAQRCFGDAMVLRDER